MVNPGRQLATGSFRPIDIGDWAQEAYEERDESASEMISQGPVHELVQGTPSSGQVDGRSPVVSQ